MKKIALVYMVAGLSARFSGRIKQFAKVGKNGETLIEYSLNQALKSSFSKIIFIVGNSTEKPFKEKFGNSFRGVPVFYALQTFFPAERDKPWGTVDALCSAKNLIDCPFVVCNGDDIYGENSFSSLFNHLNNSNEEATMGYEILNVLPAQGKTNRGIFQIEKNYVTNIKEVFNIEKNNLSASDIKENDLCSMNIFALNPNVAKLLSQKLKKFKEAYKNDRKAECLLPNELAAIIKQHKIKMKIYPSTDQWIGITNPEDELLVRKFIESSK